MIDDRNKMLLASIQKLYRRGATRNIQRILTKTHAADVAEVLKGLPIEERIDIFLLEESFDERANVFSYLEKDLQVELLQCLSKQQILKLVSSMEPDDAADLLGHLSEDEAKEILSSMVKEDSEEVADLMGYPEDTAGGLMSSDYLALNQTLTVRDAIKFIQAEEGEGLITFYIYATNDHDQLVGVASLKQLLLAKPSETLKEIMYSDVISVSVDTHQEDVARTVERYDFLSIPVVDNSNHLIGVITVDDVLDVIREEAEEDLLAMGRAGWGVNASTFEHFKARFPWQFMAFIGGGFCFLIVYLFGYTSTPDEEVAALWLVAAFIPIILGMGATTGSQAATVAVGAIRSGKFEVGKVRAHLFKEFKLSIVLAIIFGLMVVLLGRLFFSAYELSEVLALALSLQIVIAIWVGSTVPLILHRLGMDPTIVSVPIFTTVADLSAVAVLFGLYYAS